MDHVIHLSEIVGTIEDGQTEVCATADADYDFVHSKVSVQLDAFARAIPTVAAAATAATDAAPELTQPPTREWLPLAEVVTEHLSRTEASTFARDVFHSWARKVRTAVPALLHLRT